MIVTILKKRWRFLRCKPFKDDDTHGNCDPPDWKNKAIRVDKTLRGEAELETILHEMLHTAAWDLLSEQWVTDAGRDLAKALWRIGYRKEDRK